MSLAIGRTIGAVNAFFVSRSLQSGKFLFTPKRLPLVMVADA